jgi:hypothetical protein
MSYFEITLPTGVINYTYCDIVTADSYFATVFGSAWSTLTEIQKKQCLIEATRNIDKVTWKGNKATQEQELEFPRYIYCELIDMPVNAVCEEVIAIFKNGGANYNTKNTIEGVKQWSIGDISKTYSSDSNMLGYYQNQPILSNSAYQTLAKYMQLSAKVV